MADRTNKPLFPVLQRTIDRFHRLYIKQENGCWIWQGSTYQRTGYGRICPAKDRQYLAHRVSWVLKNGREIPEGMVIRHICDTPACVNPDHLIEGSKADNTRDMMERRRNNNGSAKLTEAHVRAIRTIKKLGHSNVFVGKIFGVSAGQISMINNRLHWRDVE